MTTDEKIKKAIKLLEMHGYIITPPKEEVVLTENEVKRQKLLARAEKFQQTLLPYLSQYNRQMLEDFYNYWTEPNRSLTKMRFEMCPTWDIKRRLQTWDKRSHDYGRQHPTNPNDAVANHIASIIS